MGFGVPSAVVVKSQCGINDSAKHAFCDVRARCSLCTGRQSGFGQHNPALSMHNPTLSIQNPAPVMRLFHLVSARRSLGGFCSIRGRQQSRKNGILDDKIPHGMLRALCQNTARSCCYKAPGFLGCYDGFNIG
jgi:hypothetical protein